MRWAVAVLVSGCAVMPAEGGPSDRGMPSACEVGSQRECRCGEAAGWQTCVASQVWSECGCASAGGPDVFVPPAPPPVQACGGVSCAPYPLEDTEVGAKGCCAASGACGSSSDFLFGKQCLERGGDVGQASAECPGESVNFADFDGCCRRDGKCGLSIDAVTNFDLGCVERTQMQKFVNDGAQARNNLSLIFFLPIKAASFPAKSCTFR